MALGALTLSSGWTLGNMGEAAGVFTPTSYASDAYAIYDTQQGADCRLKLAIGGTTPGDFGVLIRKADTVASLASNYYLVRFTIGSSAAPAWDDPDTITVSKNVSGVTEITPTNTSSKLRTPFVGNTVSLRDERLASGDTIMVAVVDDKILVFVNDVIRYYETITGIDAVGYFGIIHYADAGANTTFTTFESSAVTPRYINWSTGSDGNAGTAGAPWKSINKAYADSLTDEMCFIEAGTQSKSIIGYSLTSATGGGHTSTALGNPRTPAGLDDAIYLLAEPDATVITQGTIPLHAKQETSFLYTYNIGFRQSSQTSVNPAMKLWGDSGIANNCVIQGGKVLDAYHQGIQTTGAGVAAHQFIDIFVKGCGRQSGALYHGYYLSNQSNTIAWGEVDGAEYTSGWGDCQGYGIQIYKGADPGGTNNTTLKYNKTHHHLGTDLAGVAGIVIGHCQSGGAIYGNVSYDNVYGISIGFTCANMKVYNNLVYENTGIGIYEGPFTADDTLIYGNTCADNGTYGIYGESLSDNCLVTNNIAYGNATDQIAAHATAVTDGWIELTNIETDPGFEGAASDDYTLSGSGVAAATGGTTLGAPYAIDLLGFARPQQASFARGAYEYPAPPTNNPTLVMSLEYTGAPGASISLASVQAADADSDARSVYFNLTGSGTLSIDDTGVTAEGFV